MLIKIRVFAINKYPFFKDYQLPSVRSTHSFRKTITYCFLWLLLIFSAIPENYLKAQRPDFKRELRGIWIATVLNIDWPSKNNLKGKIQRKEMEKQLDYFQSIGINAVFFQIRPNANRFYKSKTEPWAEWLKGKQGKSPGYDPLKFMLKACRERGMELHAWINPYRVSLDSSKIPSHKKNLQNKHPEWIINYGKGTMLDPGLPEVRNYIGEVLQKILAKYDLDGIHYDDYFYPYPYKGTPFPDEATYRKYGSKFNSKADWRRDNVDALIQITNEVIQNIRPEVKFGVSPFGVWRNIASDTLGSVTRAGAPTYDSLYADTRKWMKNGWVDYLAPQLYWAIGFAPAAYDTLVHWWANNTFQRHIYIGQAAYKINNNYDSAWFHPSEMPNQIRLNRTFQDEIKGSIYFNAKAMLKNPNCFSDTLRNNLYVEQALPPLMPWKTLPTPANPRSISAKQKKEGIFIRWKHPTKGKNNLLPTYYAICKVDSVSNLVLLKIVDKKTKRITLKGEIGTKNIKVFSLNKHFNLQKP